MFQTDDKGLMNCSLSSEFEKAAAAYNLSKADLLQISKDSLQMSFLDKQSTTYQKLKETLDGFTIWISIAQKSFMKRPVVYIEYLCFFIKKNIYLWLQLLTNIEYVVNLS